MKLIVSDTEEDDMSSFINDAMNENDSIITLINMWMKTIS